MKQFLLAVFSSIKGKPKTDQTNQDPPAFDVKFRQMSAEQLQGALVAAEKYEKHLKDTVSSLGLGRYLGPMLAAREIDSLRAQHTIVFHLGKPEKSTEETKISRLLDLSFLPSDL